MERFIINIVCLGHSGSTLLGNILGSHSLGIHIGEVVSPLKKKRPIVCRHCLNSPCPVWGGVIEEQYLRKVYKSFVEDGNSSAINILKRIIRPSYSGDLYVKLFDGFKEKKFIVDSSKNINWYSYNARNRRLSVKYIFLKRNVNAVLAAYKRGYQRQVSDYFADIDKNVGLLNDFYNTIPEKKKIVIAYEDLIESPASDLKRLCNFLNINVEQEMLNFTGKAHHLIGGNQGLMIQADPSKADQIDELVNTKTPASTVKYYSNLHGLTLDERWKIELTSAEMLQIENGIKNKIAF